MEELLAAAENSDEAFSDAEGPSVAPAAEAEVRVLPDV